MRIMMSLFLLTSRLLRWFLLLILFISGTASADDLCFDEAGRLFNIDPLLLRSIAIVESNLQQNVIGINRNARGEIVSRDYGIMQINDMHVPLLQKQGVIRNKAELTHNACLNIKIGSWILYRHFSRCGMTWQCVGTYNAGYSSNNAARRTLYARKVYNQYSRLR